MVGIKNRSLFRLFSDVLRQFMVLAAGVFILSNSAVAEEHPFYLLQVGNSENSFALLVDKKSQKLELYRSSPDGPMLIKQYRCTTGRNNNGTKKKEGDNKTPNGIYFFRGILEDDQLPAKYGIRAFTMDYPNDFDRLNKKTGSGIWLHGVVDNSRVEINYDTDGCVVVTNDDILDLSRYLELRDTPIIVDDSIYTLNHAEFESQRENVRSFAENWVSAWRNKELDRYMDCYEERFMGSGRNKAGHRAHKAKLNKRYKKIEIALSDLRIYQYHDYAVISFIQDYRSDLFRSRGRKLLYLSRTAGGLKIFSERFRRLP
jgi:murein L,D-transpeptidase YafK